MHFKKKNIFDDLGLDFEIIKSPYEEVLDNQILGKPKDKKEIFMWI